MNEDTFEMMLVFAGLAWFASCFVVSFVAGEKNRSDIGWWFIAFFVSPLVALVALAALPMGEERELAPVGHYAPMPKSPDISQKFSG
jgi:hypothetical protein